MATAVEAQAASADLDALTAVLAAEFAREAAPIPGIDPVEAAGLLRDLAAELVDSYGRAASLIAAEWYEDLRPSGGFDPVILFPDLDALQRDMNWALKDLIAKEQADYESAIRHSIEVADLATMDTARRTTVENLRRDPLDVRYMRHASASACAFCAMLASRQAVYRSSDAAGVAAHRKCHCIPVPVWPGDDAEEAPYVANWRDTYYAARKAAKREGDVSTSAILAHMRRIGGLR